MTLDNILAKGTDPEVLGDGYGFTEGPAADQDGNVYFSDGKNNSIHRWQPGDCPNSRLSENGGDCPNFRLSENGTVPFDAQPRPSIALFTDDSTDANGMMFNAHGELYVCEGTAYRVVAYDVRTPGDCPNFRVSENGTVPFDAAPALDPNA